MNNLEYFKSLLQTEPLIKALFFTGKLWLLGCGLMIIKALYNYVRIHGINPLRVFKLFGTSLIVVIPVFLWITNIVLSLKYAPLVTSWKKDSIIILSLLLIHSAYLYYKIIKWLFPNFIIAKKKQAKRKKQLSKVAERPNVISFPAEKPIIITNIYRGLLISGGASSGKSASFVYPLLNQMVKKGFTGVVYDYKNPELSAFVKRAAILHNCSNQIVTIDFKNVHQSDRLNLLQGLTRAAEVKELSSSLWKNLNNDAIENSGSFWNSSSENVLTSTMYSLIKLFPKYATVAHALAILMSFKLEELVHFISIDNQSKGLSKQLINSFELGSSNQTSGTVGTLLNYVSVLNTPEIFYILSGKDMSIPNSIGNPSIVLLGNDTALEDTYSPIIAMIMTGVLKQMNQPNRKKSMVVVDEMPTIYLPTLKTIPAVSRSNKVAVCCAVQDKSQLEEKYGEAETKVILSNLGSQFFGRSTLENTNKYVSDIFGKKDVSFRTTSRGNSNSLKGFSESNTVSEAIQERLRLKPQEIASFKPGQFAGFVSEGTPTQFTSNQVKPFDTKPFDAINLPSQNNLVSDDVLQRNFDRIYRECQQIKKEIASGKFKTAI